MQVTLAVQTSIVYLPYRKENTMKDFFADCEKTQPKEEPSKDDNLNIDEVRKIVSVEVKKGIDTFMEEWANTHAEPTEEEKEEIEPTE